MAQTPNYGWPLAIRDDDPDVTDDLSSALTAVDTTVKQVADDLTAVQADTYSRAEADSTFAAAGHDHAGVYAAAAHTHPEYATVIGYGDTLPAGGAEGDFFAITQ